MSPAFRWSLWLASVWIAAGLMLTVTSGHAQTPYDASDTIAAIHEASADTGVSEAYLTRVVRCETGGSFDPYSIGRQGELGAAQLHPRGLLPVFFAWGYLDPFSPYQSIRFLAQEVSFGRARAWSCS